MITFPVTTLVSVDVLLLVRTQVCLWRYHPAPLNKDTVVPVIK